MPLPLPRRGHWCPRPPKAAHYARLTLRRKSPPAASRCIGGKRLPSADGIVKGALRRSFLTSNAFRFIIKAKEKEQETFLPWFILTTTGTRPLAGEFDQNTTSASAISSSRNTPSRPSIPPMEYIFQRALRLTPLLLGQGGHSRPGPLPRPRSGARSVLFSVQPGVKVPPSLQNIYKELKSDLASSRQRTARSPNGRSRAF